MNALDDDEIGDVERNLLRNPSLREELELLRKEILPLTAVSREEFLPPLGLADRTCARIWTSVDHPHEQFVERKAASIYAGRFRMLDEILAVSPKADEFQISTVINFDHFPVSSPPSETPASPSTLSSSVDTIPNSSCVRMPGRQVPKTQADRRTDTVSRRSLPKVSGDMRPDVSQGGWRLADLVASVAVGILIAVIAFPAINFARHRTETMVTQSRLKEFGQAASFYTQLEGRTETENDAPTSSQSINLASSSWRKVDPNHLPLLQVSNDSPLGVGSSLGGSRSLFKTVSDRSPMIGEQQGRMIILGQEPQSSAESEKSYSALLTDVEKAIPVSNGSSVQPAYGQNVLFQDGHVFFRVLPIFQQPNADE